jgi:Dyp-type peroxidase family
VTISQGRVEKKAVAPVGLQLGLGVERWIDRRARDLLHLMRRLDPFYRPFFNRVLREPIASVVQALYNWHRPNQGLALAEERIMPGEKEALASIIRDMGAYMRAMYTPGTFLRVGNTKTHGVVRGEIVIRDDVPAPMRQGIFAQPRTYQSWVRFSGPGPDSPKDIDDVGFGSIAIKMMGVPGEKLLDDEKYTQDLICVSTPTFVTPDVVQNALLQTQSNLRGTPFMYFWRPGATHILDFFMQGLWNETKTSPLESQYWSCVPYLLGEGQAMMYSVRPKVWTRSRVPNLPFRPPDNYLRDALLDTLAAREVEFDILVQVQTDPHRMPIENAGVRWPEKLSPWVPVATLRLFQQAPSWPAQLDLANRLSYNPWHCLKEHRPLGNQSRARYEMYQALSHLRQSENRTPHIEPTGNELFETTFDDPARDDGAVWERQGGVTIYAAVRPDSINALKGELAAIQARVQTDGMPFKRSRRLHYARFVFVEETIDAGLGHCGPGLAYQGDFDGSRQRHLDELTDFAADELNRIGRFLVDPIGPDVASRRQWLQDHIIADATFYVNAVGRSVRQIRSEARLRERIEDFLDRNKTPVSDPRSLHWQILDFIRSEPSLQWALKPVRDTSWRIRRFIGRVALIVVALPVLILTFPLLLLWAFAIRWHEKIEYGDPPISEPAHVAELANAEDTTLQNQFSAVGFRKASWLRLISPVVFLWLANIVVRYFFDTNNLANLKTIHFAHWTFIDGKRRMLFTSNYDGSHENYMGDFIDIVGWGLNASFSHGVEYPRTRWLIVDGAWNERTFKRHNRNRQITTQVWYAAYPNLSAVTIAENAKLRASLSAPQREKNGIDWLKLLRRDWGRPAAQPVVLEREDMQALLTRGHSHHKAACFFLLTFADRADGVAAAKRWLGDLINDPDVAMNAKREQPCVHLAFTAEGLRHFGCAESLLAGFSDEFQFGMATEHRQRLLGDTEASSPAHWEWGRADQKLHAVLMLYAADEDELARVRCRYEAAFNQHGIRAIVRETTWLANKKEHFGFHDGITTPPIEGIKPEPATKLSIKPGEFIFGYQNEYHRYPTSPLIHRALDPLSHLKLDVEGSGMADFGRNGSYLVFRQLRQDVFGFWSFVDQAARAIDGTSDKRDWLAAKMVGRWRSGAPLALSPNRDDLSLENSDDFMFHKNDQLGLRCPIGSHIRRTNPRDSLDPQPGSEESLSLSKLHRLLRRGRTYGDCLAGMDPDAILAQGDDGRDRGLHFICLNANISRQFEFVQSSWSNNPQFGTLYDDVDPLTGERGRFGTSNGAPGTANFTIPHEAGRTRIRNIPNFVTVRGGAYFFMPGMSALRYLATLPS